MESFQLIILLMAASILMVGAAQKLAIPYPITLVVGGAVLGFFPGLEAIDFDPNLILLVVLPPILYHSAYWISFREFKKNAREIFSMALGLVVVTTVVIGVLFKWLFPDLPWALAFTFGALISPPDAISATSILKRFDINSRLLTVLEGESLVNDAFALVLYRFGVAALLLGSFSWIAAGEEFIKIAFGGVLVGVCVGYSIHMFSHFLLSPVLGAVFAFTIPYITYIFADYLGVSGVLAVVTNGLILSRLAMKYHQSQRHMLVVAGTDIYIILLNCFVFILIGLQLRTLTAQMTGWQIVWYIGYAILIMFVMLTVRMLWICMMRSWAYFRARTSANLQKTSQIISEGVILGWSGMRGIVSLTAVLALPLTLPDHGPLIGRDLVIFITFVVILLSLLIPGLSLAWLLRKLKIQHFLGFKSANDNRKRLLNVAENVLHKNEELDLEERSFLINYFYARHRVLELSSNTERPLQKLERIRHHVLESQRKLLLQMWENKEIDDKHLKFLELELDLEESLTIRAELE